MCVYCPQGFLPHHTTHHSLWGPKRSQWRRREAHLSSSSVEEGQHKGFGSPEFLRLAQETQGLGRGQC